MKFLNIDMFYEFTDTYLVFLINGSIIEHLRVIPNLNLKTKSPWL